MKINIYATITLNGFIADKNGEEDIFDDTNWNSFVNVSKAHKAILWGRKTLNAILTWGDEYLESLKDVKIYVLTKTKQQNFKNVIYINSFDEIKESQVLISGGRSIYEYALKNLKVKKIIFNVNPIILDEGIAFSKEKTYLTKFNKFKILEQTKKYIQIELTKN